eukprot:TRINITY_DN61480_c0_g1_i1.p1 TRINITY_DN61480_c0_g1~~TRINITY_DN61480_c0_g1_i1.p1  ORF type:complete len:156 (+),score=29.28 TRINITY_DN61480_c0_g1_i1:66-533(+)
MGKGGASKGECKWCAKGECWSHGGKGKGKGGNILGGVGILQPMFQKVALSRVTTPPSGKIVTPPSGKIVAPQPSNVDPFKTIWVGSLPDGTTSSELKAHAEEAGLPVIWAKIHANNTGAIGFQTPGDATMAVETLNASMFGDELIAADTWQNRPQ